MSKRQVLMLTPYLPYPPVSGGRMRTYNLMKFLRDDCDITLACFGRPDETAFDITPLGALCDYHVVERAESPGTLQAALMSLSSLSPITMRLYGGEAMRDTIARLLSEKRYDAIHVESFYMMQNVPENLGIPVLLSEPAIEYQVWAQHAKVSTPFFIRPGIALEAFKMRVTEPRAWAQADAVGAMSALDQRLIKQRAPSAQVFLTPNGVDVDFFTPDETVMRDDCTAVYMGDYKYFPNVDAVLYFAQEILPLIRAKRPDFKLTLLGKDPSPEIQALAGDGVTVTGLVEDTRPYLQGSAVFVCPLRSGSGTRFKLMEALACGCPVVSTAVGCEGLDAIDGEHMLIRDDPQAFADAVIDLLGNPERGAAIGRAGRAWVVEKHAWSHSAALVKQAYTAIETH
jgi:sugar transferase (PEP-CTERM/EpsH1 system associated)